MKPTALPVHESLAILRTHQIPVAPFAIAAHAFELSHIQFGFPWVMKLSSNHFTHKTEQNAVRLHLHNREDANAAFAELKKIDTHADIVVQPQLSGTELFIGSTIDPQFGATIVAGLGGIFVELLQDTSLRVLPIQKKDALAMIAELKHPKLLRGFRGKPPVNPKEFAEIILKTAQMLEQNHFLELDINPLMATKKGIFAVDARIVK